MTVSGKILSVLRKKIDEGTTVYVVAKAVGVSHSIIARFLSAERKQIRSETIDRLCEYLSLELVESPTASGKPATPTAGKPATGKPAKKPAKKAARGKRS